MAAMWLFALDPTFSGRCCWPGRVRIRLCGIQACGKALNGIPPEGQGVWTREGGVAAGGRFLWEGGVCRAVVRTPESLIQGET